MVPGDTGLQVILAKIFHSFELVQKVINPRDRVPIFYSNLVQHPIGNIESPSPILLLHQHDQALTGRGTRPDVTFLQQLLNMPLDFVVLQNKASIDWSIG